MSVERNLREKAREVIQAGKLPNRRPDRTWGGPGAGACCTICNAPLKQDEVELEIEFARGVNHAAVDKYHVHVRCFAAWNVERQTFERTGAAAPSSDQTRSTPASRAGGPLRSNPGTTVGGRSLPQSPNIGNIAGHEFDSAHKRGPA